MKRNPFSLTHAFHPEGFRGSGVPDGAPAFSPSIEICILAGGLSQRMGRDKSRLRLGPTTILGHIRKTARATGLPVRVIRRDSVPKCGPLGGIYTALKTTKSDAVLFLACDMPLVSTGLLQLLLRQIGAASTPLSPLFVGSRGRAGFPFMLPRQAIQTVDRQIQTGALSLQALAKLLRANTLELVNPWSQQLVNVNTPKDWAALRAKLSTL
jgi:molybdopterin-guanine dinucleotide biosynthesis protein A